VLAPNKSLYRGMRAEIANVVKQLIAKASDSAHDGKRLRVAPKDIVLAARHFDVNLVVCAIKPTRKKVAEKNGGSTA